MLDVCFTMRNIAQLHISPAISEEQPIFHLKYQLHELHFWIFFLAHGSSTIWGKQGVGSNGRKGQCPFQPDDVLAGAERRELEGIEGIG